MHTFKLNNVNIAEKKLEERSVQDAFKIAGKLDPESWSDPDETIVPADFNAFVYAIHSAFHDHRPLILDPDSVWITIAQGFSQHIEQNAEKFRHQFVQHEDKETIEVQRDFFVRQQQNDWPDVFDEFSSKIKEYIGKKHDLIVSDFSTTTPLAKTISEIVLMDSMKSYFNYLFKTMCGIPRITLEGTTEDWENIKFRTENLSEFDLGWWTSRLVPVLEEFVRASKGNVNKEFWNNIYKEGGGSGGPYITGWINTFFPYSYSSYTGKYSINKDKEKCSNNSFGMEGLTNDRYPSSLSQVPFVWNYYGKFFDYQFVGGLLGIEQNEELALKPKMGWAVQEVSKIPEKLLIDRQHNKKSARKTNYEMDKGMIHREVTVLPADNHNKKSLGLKIKEKIGIAVVNITGIKKAKKDTKVG